MLRWLLRLILTVIILFIVGSIGLIYVMSRDVTPPDTRDIDIIPVFDTNIRESLELRQEKGHRLSKKKQALREQKQLLEEKEELLALRTKELDNYIFKELSKIRDKYQREIDFFQDNLDQDYQQFVDRKEQEYRERMLVKQELYQKKMIDLVNNYEESLLLELEENNQSLLQEYHRGRLDYELKVKFLDLPESKENEYKERLAELEERHLSSLAENEGEIFQEIDQRIREIEEDFNQELSEFQNQLRREMEEDLLERQTENDLKLNQFLKEQEALMEAEFANRRREIRSRSENELTNLSSLIRDLRIEFYRIQSEVSILEKEVDF